MSQVKDDPALLDQMLAEYENAPDEFRPTRRWLGYSQRFVNFLRTEGLHDFRRRRLPRDHDGFVLARFGAIDLNPSFGETGPTETDLYHAARAEFVGAGAGSIEDLPASRVGNPEGFEVEGRFYTLSWLNFYCRYAFASRHVAFDGKVVVEVGPGSGKQAEMLKRAHPSLTILLFDLPTQLYVCNQYLTKVFEGTGEVVDYREHPSIRTFDDICPGKINILPHWKIPMIEGRRFDLLWNAASLQEMGAQEAQAYFRRARGAAAMYLMHVIRYREGVERPGDRGVISPLHLKGFTEIARSEARLVHRPQIWRYYDSFWTKTVCAPAPAASTSLRRRVRNLMRRL